MNAQIPLIREGLKPVRGKSNFFFKVVLVLTLHVVVIGILLLQGCMETNARNASTVAPAPDTAPPTDAATPDQKPRRATDTNSPKALVNQPLSAPLQPATVAPNRLAAAPADTTVYMVKAGDTLGRIARLHHTSPEIIMVLNDLKASTIKIGQKLKVPGPKVA
jgi:LysM repeat protein